MLQLAVAKWWMTAIVWRFHSILLMLLTLNLILTCTIYSMVDDFMGICMQNKATFSSMRQRRRKHVAIRCCSWEILIRNPDPFSLKLGCPVVPLVFLVSLGEIISWHDASCLWTFMSWNRAFDLSTGGVCRFDGSWNFARTFLTKDNDKQKGVGKFGYLTYFSRRVHLCNIWWEIYSDISFFTFFYATSVTYF